MKFVLTPQPVERVFAQCSVCFLPEDNRPLRGGVGAVDWALNGLITRLLCKKTLTGSFLESTLIRPGQLLPAEKLVLLGLGRVDECSPEHVQQLGHRLIQVLLNLRVVEVALAFPEEVGEGISTDQVAENLTAGYITGMDIPDTGDIISEMTLAISMDPDVMDEALLGIQRAKVALKTRFEVLVLK